MQPEEMIDRWFVVATNVRCERRAVRSLRAAGYRVYWPRHWRRLRHRRSKRRMNRIAALLSGYVFVRMTRTINGYPDWYTLRQADGVREVLGIDGQPIPINRADVVRFVRWQRQRKFDDAVPVDHLSRRARRQAVAGRFRPGAMIRFVDGAFGGIFTVVERVNAKGKIEAVLQFFGQATAVEVDPEEVELVNN